MKGSKKAKIISLASLGIASVTAVGTSTTALINQQNDPNSFDSNLNVNLNQNQNTITNPSIEGNLNNNVQQTKPLISSASNYFNAKLSSVNGPILFWDNKITSADWFGAERWSKNLDTEAFGGKKFNLNPNNDHQNGWRRAWLNWDLDKKNNILYVLSTQDLVNKKPTQNVLAIDVLTGNILHMYELEGDNSGAFFAVSVLENGNLLVYGQQKHASTRHILIDTKSKKWKINSGDLEKISELPKNEGNNDYSKSKNYLMNLIPIAPNRNLAMTYNMTSHSNTDNDAGADQGTSQVEFILCDDNMKIVQTADQKWKKPVLATLAIKNTKNSAIWPQRDWYKLIDGRVVTVIYDKLIIIDAKNPNNLEMNVFELDKDGWVESWSFDTNENLFYKVKGDSKIKKVTLPKGSGSPSVSEYYDLKNTSIDKIRDNASSFNLYNVYGYAGQIMLVNTWFWKWVNSDEYPDKKPDHQDKDKMDTFGLAAAVTDHKNSSGSGDIKGLLNTDQAFQKSADFKIEENILKNKLPSEITRNDLSFTEKGFLTNNKKTAGGKLLYPPFTKLENNDQTKKLVIEANVDQIPWFVGDNKMPENIIPLKIKKEFVTGEDISKRFAWKSVNDDYDFKNTLPSKLTVEDVNRIDPFIINVNSQKVEIGGEKYPKLKYSLSEANDTTGTIKITAEYKYLPMDVSINKTNLLTYSQSQTFNIFKNTDNKNFQFIGNGEDDITKINELKELKEANVLPSVFEKADPQAFIKFIDVNKTKGYPLSKMKITVNANDTKGELSLTVDAKNYDSNAEVKTKVFKGFNKINEYQLSFQSSKNNFDKKHYRPSDISEEIFFENFITYSGFDATDLHLELFANDNKGSLSASLYLLSDYPKSALTNTPFEKDSDGKWIAKKSITGFKNTDEFNKEYQLIFKKDNDSSLASVKELTPSEIVKAFDNKPSTKKDILLGDKFYKDKHDFVNQVFVDKMGLKMPKLEATEDIKIDLFANNSGGELTIKIVFKNVDGYSIPLTFIQIFTGFAKGNDVVTEDVLVLKNQMQLENSMKEILKAYPSQVKEKLLSNKMLIHNFFTTNPTGDYKIALENKKFELFIDDNDIHGQLIITIKFKREDIKNSNSLLEYSQIYTNLNHY